MFEMDDRNLELEAWLIEAAGEEMMANHLGPNWNKFDEEFGFYPNMGMTVTDLVWQHQQAKVEELQTQLSLQRQRVKAFEEELTSSRNYGDELQKRVDKALELMQKPLIVGEPAKYVCARFKEIEQALKGEG